MNLGNLPAVEEGDYMVINGEPFHKVGRQSVIITMPTPDIILDESFDYGRYVDDYFRDALEYRKGNYQGYFEDLEEVNLSELFDGEVTIQKVDARLKELDDSYCHEIYVLQHQYENAYNEGYADKVNSDITSAMKGLTSDYMTQRDSLKAEICLQELEEIQAIMDEALREAKKQQFIFEDNLSKERVAAYKAGNLPLSELNFRDLSKLPATAKIQQISRYLHARITDGMVDNYDVYNMTLKDTLNLIESFVPSSGKKR